MINSMYGMRIAGDNRLCHALAGIVTGDPMDGDGSHPRGRGDWPHSWGGRPISVPAPEGLPTAFGKKECSGAWPPTATLPIALSGGRNQEIQLKIQGPPHPHMAADSGLSTTGSPSTRDRGRQPRRTGSVAAADRPDGRANFSRCMSFNASTVGIYRDRSSLNYGNNEKLFGI